MDSAAWSCSVHSEGCRDPEVEDVIMTHCHQLSCQMSFSPQDSDSEAETICVAV